MLYLNNYAIFWNSGFAEVKQGTHEKEIFGKKLLIGPIMDTKLSFLLKYIKTKTHFFQNSTPFSEPWLAKLCHRIVGFTIKSN